MPDVLLFGATGYTGTLTAHALHERDISFAIAGRDRDKLEKLSAATGSPEVRVANVGDVDGLVGCLNDVRTLVTCVGPFEQLGDTAVEAALRAGVNYIDSTGEATFIGRLINEVDTRARSAGIAMAPAFGFDEVPVDVAVRLATASMTSVDLKFTYAFPSTASAGTARSMIGIASSDGRFVEDGSVVNVGMGARSRWAPMPPPLGPRFSISVPTSELLLAPLHVDVHHMGAYATIGTTQRWGLKVGLPILRLAGLIPRGPETIQRLITAVGGTGGPEGEARNAAWTVLAEARNGQDWRNVSLQGTDVYGLTAKLLAFGAERLSRADYERVGVLAPTQAVDVDDLQKLLIDHGVTIETYERTG